MKNEEGGGGAWGHAHFFFSQAPLAYSNFPTPCFACVTPYTQAPILYSIFHYYLRNLCGAESDMPLAVHPSLVPMCEGSQFSVTISPPVLSSSTLPNSKRKTLIIKYITIQLHLKGCTE